MDWFWTFGPFDSFESRERGGVLSTFFFFFGLGGLRGLEGLYCSRSWMFPYTFLRLSLGFEVDNFFLLKLSWIEVRTLIFYFLVLLPHFIFIGH